MLIIYAIVNIACLILSLLLNVTVTHARSEQVVQSVIQANPNLNTPAMKSAVGLSNSLGAVIALTLFMMIWPVLVLYFMNRPHVKAAFEKGPLPGR